MYFRMAAKLLDLLLEELISLHLPLAYCRTEHISDKFVLASLLLLKHTDGG